MARLDLRAQIAENFVEGRQRLAMPGFLIGKFEHRTLRGDDLLAQPRGLLIELDVFGQDSGAIFSPPGNLSGELRTAIRHLAELGFKPCPGRTLASVPLFQSSQP